MPYCPWTTHYSGLVDCELCGFALLCLRRAVAADQLDP
jgi:hypothetical protein